MKAFQWFVLLYVFSIHAIGQTVLSFSGLSWGDDVDQTGTKLKASRLSFNSILDKYTCKIQARCSIRFGDSVRGEAEFDNNRLVSVWIFSEQDANSYQERLSRLKERYGSPSLCSSFPASLNLVSGNGYDLCWLKNGETIEIIEGGSIKYKSTYYYNRDKKDSSSVKF